MVYEALLIAKWFVAWAEADEADLSNLKLQKLLYYAQGHHLGAYGKPLFNEPVQAWAHGPVVSNVYHTYKTFASGDLHLDERDPFVFDDVAPKTTDFLVRVWNTYGEFAAWRLRNMTHEAGTPWATAFRLNQRYVEIPQDAMRKYFRYRTIGV